MCHKQLILCVLITSCFIASQCMNIVNTTFANPIKENEECGNELDYKCGSGECISLDMFCDGTEDCKDGFDENNCRNNTCQASWFQCEYGACIRDHLRCNSEANCKDASDEFNCTYPVTNVTQRPVRPVLWVISNRTEPLLSGNADKGCILPPYPENGEWRVFGRSNNKNTPGGSIPERSLLIFRCNNDYGAYPNEYQLCSGGKWTSETKCLKLCRPVPKTPGLQVKCFVKNLEVDCAIPYETTIAEVHCKDVSINFPARYCFDGSWDAPFPQCESIKSDIDVTLRSTTLATLTFANSGVPTSLLRPGDKNSCILPPYPENGKWRLIGQSIDNYAPGEIIGESSALSYQCKDDYGVYPDLYPVCYEGKWTAEPKCLKLCPPLHNTMELSVKCTLGGQTVDCSKPFENTRADLACNEYYENADIRNYPTRFCNNRSWGRQLPLCEPICGRPHKRGSPLVIGGKAAMEGAYPWIVGLYRRNDTEQFCAGSIIKADVVLTAAHCFEHSEDKDKYLVAAGKFYRKYLHEEDKYAQYSRIKYLLIHKNFNGGAPNFAFDIALILMETPFRWSELVLPVCMSYDPFFRETSLVDAPGVLAGWGFTKSNSAPSEVLKELNVTYRTEDQCLTQLPVGIQRFLIQARDKLCAGSETIGEAACQGDSGGGVYFKLGDRYYIRGIVSLSAKDVHTLGCDAKSLTLFTGVHYHAHMIQNFPGI